jgi:putative transposase
VEENIGETLTCYQLPLQHHKHLKSTNMLERFNEEIKRRTRVARIFPHEASWLRLIRGLAAEALEGWWEANRDLNMDLLKEYKKLRIRPGRLTNPAATGRLRRSIEGPFSAALHD